MKQYNFKRIFSLAPFRGLGAVIILFLPLFSYSQDFIEAPDYPLIKELIEDKNSGFFYDDLLVKFNKADTTMTLEEKRNLYYGAIFQSDYSPYGRSAYSDSVMVILRKEKLTVTDYDLVLSYTDSILIKNPLDSRALYDRLYIYDMQGETQSYDNAIFKLRVIFDAILSSGDGLSKETAYYVIATSHEYDIMRILGFQPEYQSLTGHYDYQKLAKNRYDIEALYFDVSPALKHLNDMFSK